MALVNLENTELVMDGRLISYQLTQNHNGVAYFRTTENHIWSIIIRQEQLVCDWEKVCGILSPVNNQSENIQIRGVVKRILMGPDNEGAQNVSFPGYELHLMDIDLMGN